MLKLGYLHKGRFIFRVKKGSGKSANLKAVYFFFKWGTYSTIKTPK